jgi:hypothetical protein
MAVILPHLLLDLYQFVAQNLRLAAKVAPFAEMAIRELANLVRLPGKEQKEHSSLIRSFNEHNYIHLQTQSVMAGAFFCP